MGHELELTNDILRGSFQNCDPRKVLRLTERFAASVIGAGGRTASRNAT